VLLPAQGHGLEARRRAGPQAAVRRRRLGRGLTAEPLHPAAAVGFDHGAASYERGRPSYPADTVAWLVEGLGIGPGRRVLDLAAGTGKFTRLLVPTGADLVAVEPVAGMREQFHEVLPEVPIVDGTADAIPEPDDSVDVVTVAQAFHWFDLPRACDEIHRVLRPGGGLGLVWNERDTSVGWVAELSRIIRWDERGEWQVPYTVEVDWIAEFAEGSGRFGPLEVHQSRHTQELDADTLVSRVLSTSYIAASTHTEQHGIEARVRELVADFPDRFELPYVTVAYRGHAVG
jgi:SAM-dependent methyltransferase